MGVYRKLNKCIFLAPLLFLVACSSPGINEQVYRGEALGTSFQIKFYHPEEIEIEKGLDSVFDVINKSMSTYIKDSDISKINAGDSTIVVDENFKEVFKLSNQIYEESNGYFDPTVGKIVNAFGFGPEMGQEEVNQREIDSMLTYIGFNKLQLTPEGRIQKQYPEIYIDFNAIAKGFAVDVLGRFLDDRGIKDYLVEVGGELTAKGMNRIKKQSWVAGIDNPNQTPGNRTLQAAVKLEDRAMATSGNYRKFKVDTLTGKAYVHTINPLTGYAEKSDILSASVLAENCALADGYATAFMAMGLEKSIEMLGRLDNVDAYFIYAEANEEVKVFSTKGFEESLVEP